MRAGAVLLLREVALVLLALAVTTATVNAAQWAWLGVRIRDLSEQEMDEISSRHGMREGFGVFIVEVMEGTPAQTAGMKSGDLVVAFEERQVTETRVLQRLIAASAPGKDVRLTVLRAEGRRLRFRCTRRRARRVERPGGVGRRAEERGGTRGARGRRRDSSGQRAGGRHARRAA
jgi:C-terminal processing protease CtpA/Prc